MPRRVGRPGLIGTMARTAVVAGTAGAVVTGMSRSRTAREQAAAEEQAANQAAYEAHAQLADLQARLPAWQEPAQDPAPPADVPTEEITTKLRELAELHQAGVLNDDEFAAAKAKLLA